MHVKASSSFISYKVKVDEEGRLYAYVCKKTLTTLIMLSVIKFMVL